MGGVKPHLVVLHYTGMPSFAEARARLCDPVHEVSAHWLIDMDGRAEQLVDEGRRAWHAGAGAWGGATDGNSASIGIELQNPGHMPFPEPQMKALEALLAAILPRWGMKPAGVIAHSDMAPTRKSDPGKHFDWRRLALNGLSVWPEAGPKAMIGAALEFVLHARRFGYPEADEATLLHAFRLRFRPWAKGPVDDVDAGLVANLANRFAPNA